mgnify:CR=1 FL=1
MDSFTHTDGQTLGRPDRGRGRGPQVSLCVIYVPETIISLLGIHLLIQCK